MAGTLLEMENGDWLIFIIEFKVTALHELSDSPVIQMINKTTQWFSFSMGPSLLREFMKVGGGILFYY